MTALAIVGIVFILATFFWFIIFDAWFTRSVNRKVAQRLERDRIKALHGHTHRKDARS